MFLLAVRLAVMLLMPVIAATGVRGDTGAASEPERSRNSMVTWNLGTSDSPATVQTPDLLVGGQMDKLIEAGARPFVLISERELSVLRRGLTKDGWKRTLYNQPLNEDDGRFVGPGLRSIADAWVKRSIDVPARSGHYHHFFCNCGNRLEIPDPLIEQPAYHCRACGAEFSGEKFDGAVRYIQHNRLACAAIACALVFAIERDKTYADKAAEILMKYADAYPGPHTGATEGGIMYQSLCESVWVIPLAQAYDLIYYSRSLNDEQKKTIEDRLLRPVAGGLIACGIGGNWGSWHLSAVGVIGLAVKDVSLVRYAVDSLGSQIANQLGDDGLWPESVHTYHFYPLSAFVHFAEGCWRAGIDIYNWTPKPGKSLKAMFTAPLDYVYPSFQLPAINDGWYVSHLPLSLYEIAHRRWDDSVFGWVLKNGYRGEANVDTSQRTGRGRLRNSFYALLFGRDLPGRTGPQSFRSHVFAHMGICTLRNGSDAMVTFDYGPFLGHGHLDKLGFTLYANDTVLVPDYGTPGYGSAIAGWYGSTAAHNTIVVDGESQARSTQYGLTRHSSGSFAQYADASASDCYPGVTHRRQILLLDSTCVIRDTIAGDSEHNYDWLVRVEGKPRIVGNYEPLDLDASSYSHVKLSQSLRADSGFHAQWRCESGSLALGIWAAGEPAVVGIGECPAETGSRQASFLMCRRRGVTASYLAALAPTPAGEEARVSLDGDCLTIDGQGWADYVCLRAHGGRTTSGDLQTDAEVAAVRTRGGDVTAVALMNGSVIRWKGETLLECPAPAECVEVIFEARGPVIKYCCETPGTLHLKTRARAMRVNGHRAAASNVDGDARLNVTEQMLVHSDARF